MPVETIDDVLEALDAIIDQARAEHSRLGYFAALYRRVTRAVKFGIAAGRFQDGPRMERFDVLFARRYLDAYGQFRAGAAVTGSWMVAFQAAANPALLVVQQLLVGMNAHINLDLGIAAAEVAPGAALAGLEGDFDEINAVLAEQVGAVELQMAAISPMIGLLEKLGLRTDTRIINFSLEKARAHAWDVALKLNAAPPRGRDVEIGLVDLEVELLGRLIVRPPPPLNMELASIRAVESDDIVHNLNVLAS
ncbi:MAG TPA: DUF5995 family protein [Bryobacteraceae bacterium]|nr:DUF5995 family protein [Bryobacteraceae bacterium]